LTPYLILPLTAAVLYVGWRLLALTFWALEQRQEER